MIDLSIRDHEKQEQKSDSTSDNDVFILEVNCDCGCSHSVELPLSWSKQTVKRYLRRNHFNVYADDLRELLRNWPPNRDVQARGRAVAS